MFYDSFESILKGVKDTSEPVILTINGTEIRSLPQLRECFDPEQVKAAFLDGTLKKWLSQYYYEREAQEVGALAQELTPAVALRLCEILGVACSKILSDEERTAYEAKCASIRRFTDNPAVLANAFCVATDQSELAGLLNSDHRKIYLCGGPFSIPIRKGGVHYIGVGAIKMEAPFTQEQYRRAGITLENITLPETSDKNTENLAKEAAAAYGYDDFSDEHNHLATIFHEQIGGYRLLPFCGIRTSVSAVSGESYSSRHSAEAAIRQAITETYNEANAYFAPESSICLAKKTAQDYAKFVSRAADTVDSLESYCQKNTLLGKKFSALRELFTSAEDNLRKAFESELRENSSYYQMYKLDYFIDLVNISTLDCNYDMFESDLLNGLKKLIHNETMYFIDNMSDAQIELDNDLRSHAETFFGAAFDAFCNYRERIEKIAEEIGEDLSDDELVRLGILKKDEKQP